jgi:hypothetical protein
MTRNPPTKSCKSALALATERSSDLGRCYQPMGEHTTAPKEVRSVAKAQAGGNSALWRKQSSAGASP